MKRIVALVSLLLCVALALGSCSFTAMSFKKLYKKYEHEAAHTFTTAAEVSALSGLSYENRAEQLLAFSGEDDVLKFYNAETETVVLTLTESDKVTYNYDLFTVYGAPFIYVYEMNNAGDEYTTYARIYDAKGNRLAEEKNPDSTNPPVGRTDLFKFDDLIWRVTEDGSAEKITESAITSYLPNVNYKTEKFYYYITDYSVSVYDDELNSAFYWEVPFDMYEDSEIFLLDDGVLLAQVVERLPDDAKKYDYRDDEGNKMDLVTYILNAKREKAKEVDLDFYVEDVYCDETLDVYNPDEDDDFLPKKVINIAYGYFIEDHRVNSRDTAVTIKTNGSTFELAPEFDEIPEPIAEDRWLDMRDNGEVYLIDGKGKVVANITAIRNADVDLNEKFVAVDGKLYDHDLKLVYDAEENDEEIEELLNTAVILSKEVDGETKYYLYKADGTKTEIADYYGTFRNNYITSKDGTYTLYNEAGTKLVESKRTFSGNIVYENRDGDVIIIKVYTGDGQASKYFKLT